MSVKSPITMLLLYVFVLFCRPVFVLFLHLKMFFWQIFKIANILQDFGKEPRLSTNMSRTARQDKPFIMTRPVAILTLKHYGKILSGAGQNT